MDRQVLALMVAFGILILVGLLMWWRQQMRGGGSDAGGWGLGGPDGGDGDSGGD